MLEQVEHPTKDELSAFSLGQLPNAEAASVENHISHCDACCETLLGLEAQDTFLGLLQGAKPAPGIQTVGVDTPSDRTSSISNVPAQLAEHPRYEILGLIGKGGMGDVFKARHRRMERTVALKVINHELVRKPEAVERFHREVKTAASLSHPNIVTAHDADHVDDVHFLVMEFVDGVNLDEVVRERGPLPVADACDYIRQAAAGLQHAHVHGMVHRDIKPHNLMLAASGEVKILDFGLASFASEIVAEEVRDEAPETLLAANHLTQAGSMMGTPDYIAPEQAKDAHEADIRSDIYSLGCTFYTLLAGQAPFGSGSVLDKLKAHREQAPPPLSRMRHDVPAEVEAILLRMLAKNPAERFQTPAEVVAALGEYHRAKAERALGTAPLPRRARRRPWALIAVATLVMGIFLAATVFYIQTDNGVVRVEVADESLQVKLNGRTIEMKDGDTQLSIRAGEQKLVVRRGDFVFETESFQLRRGDKVALKVELLDGKVVVIKDGERFGARSLPENAGPSMGSVAKDELKLVRRLQGHTAQIYKVAFTRDGKRAISVSDDCTACFWDVETGQLLLQSKQSGCQMRGIVVSPDGRYAVTTGLAIVLWDLSGPRFLRTLMQGGVNDVAHTAAFTADGRLVAVGSPRSGKLRAWEVATGREVYETQGTTAEISPSGGLLATRRRNAIALLEPESGELVRLLEGQEAPGIHFSSDGRLLATSSPDGSIIVYEVETGKPLHTWKFAGRPSAASFLADGARLFLYTQAPDNMLRVMDLKTGQELMHIKGHSASVSNARVLPGERFVLSSAADGTLRLWDLQDGRELSRTDTGGHATERLAVSPDGRFVLSAGGHTLQSKGEAPQTRVFEIYLWQLPESVWPQKGMNLPVSLRFSMRDGKSVVEIQGERVETGDMVHRVKALVTLKPGLVLKLELGEGVDPSHATHAQSLGGVQRVVEMAGGKLELPPPFVETLTRLKDLSLRRHKRSQALERIGLAMHAYHDNWKQFPPAKTEAKFDVEGRPLLSWRVHLLPYLDSGALYKRFRLDQPWDSPHNKALLPEMPAIFKTTNETTKTTFLAVVGEGTMYEGKAGLKLSDIADGSSNTALVVDAGKERAVPWTKPEDLPLVRDDPIRAFGTAEFGNAFLALMGDGRTEAVAYDAAPEMLRNLFMRADGKKLDLDAKRTTPIPALTK